MSAALEQSSPPVRWAFARGALIGFVLGIPLVGVTVLLLARWGLGDPGHTFRDVLRLTLMFAGAPLMLTAGGIARVAARAATAAAARGLRAGALTGAAAGPGLLILAAIPLGRLPDTASGWLWYVPSGAILGAVLGALIALSVTRG